MKSNVNKNAVTKNLNTLSKLIVSKDDKVNKAPSFLSTKSKQKEDSVRFQLNMDKSKLSTTKRPSKFFKSPLLSEKSFANDSFEKIMGSGKGSIKEIIENANIDQKVISLIDDTCELFNDKTVTMSKDEKERYELIEKTALEKLKKDNEEYKLEKARKTEEYADLLKNFSKVNNDHLKLTDTYNNQEKYKLDIVNKIYFLQDNLKQLILENHKINEMIHKERIEQENIFRALVTFTKNNNAILPKDLKELYMKFNNEYYTQAYKVNKSDKIQTLKLRIEELENTVKEKNEEINKKTEQVRLALENKSLQN